MKFLTESADISYNFIKSFAEALSLTGVDEAILTDPKYGVIRQVIKHRMIANGTRLPSDETFERCLEILFNNKAIIAYDPSGKQLHTWEECKSPATKFKMLPNSDLSKLSKLIDVTLWKDLLI